MAITLIHNPACTTSGAATTLDVSPGGAVAVGDLILVGAAHRDLVGGTMTCADSQGNSYTRIGLTPPDTDHSRQVFWTIATAASTPTVTLTCSGSAQLGGFSVVYRGTTATPIYNLAESVDGTWTTSWSQIAAGAVASGDVAFGMWINAYGAGSAGASPPNSNFQYAYNFSLLAIADEDAVPWGGGTPSAEFSNDSTQIGAGTVCFGIAAAGAGSGTASAIARAVTTVRANATATTPGVASALTRAVTTVRGFASASTGSGGGSGGGTITVTDRGYTAATGGPTANSGNFTPANGSVIVALGYGFVTGSETITYTDNWVDTGGGAWTEARSVSGTNVFGHTAHLRGFYRKIGTSPGSGHVTINCVPAANIEFQFVVAELAGVYLPQVVPGGQTANAAASVTPITTTLPVAPATDSIVFSGILDLSNASAPATPTNYTSLGSGAPYLDGFRAAYDNANAAAVVSYASLNISNPNIAVMFEIASSPSVAVPGFTISDNFGDTGGGIWTTARAINGSGAEVLIAYRRVGSNPISGIVTATAANTTQGREMSVLELGNRNNDNPVPTNQHAAFSEVIANPSMTMPATPSTDSIVVAGAISRGHGTAPGTAAGHTSLVNTSAGGDGYTNSYDGANALAVVAYTGLATTRNLGAMAEFRRVISSPPPGGGGGGGGGGGQYYTSTSTWNTKIPANATYIDEPSLRSGGGWINYENFATPFTRSTPADPLVTVTIPDCSWGWTVGTSQIRIPSNGYGADGSDGSLIVLDTTTNLAHDFWIFERAPGALTASCRAYARSNVVTEDGWGLPPPAGCGNGLGAGIHVAGSALLAGNIINNELTLGINHTLAVAMRHDMSTGWPNVTGRALSSDGGGGVINMGERIAIPPNVPMPGGLKIQEQMVWKCMQEYGAFIVDTAGGSHSIYWTGDSITMPPEDGLALLNPGVWNSPGLTAIVQQVRIVR